MFRVQTGQESISDGAQRHVRQTWQGRLDNCDECDYCQAGLVVQVIGLDTNVLVRYIMQDDVKQAALATRLIERLNGDAPGYISIVTIVELCWVLESGFALSRTQIVGVYQGLMSVDAFKIDRVSVVAAAIRAYGDGKADFADYLIERLSVLAGCKQTVTFDRAAAKSGAMTLIQ